MVHDGGSFGSMARASSREGPAARGGVPRGVPTAGHDPRSCPAGPGLSLRLRPWSSDPFARRPDVIDDDASSTTASAASLTSSSAWTTQTPVEPRTNPSTPSPERRPSLATCCNSFYADALESLTGHALERMHIWPRLGGHRDARSRPVPSLLEPAAGADQAGPRDHPGDGIRSRTRACTATSASSSRLCEAGGGPRTRSSTSPGSDSRTGRCSKRRACPRYALAVQSLRSLTCAPSGSSAPPARPDWVQAREAPGPHPPFQIIPESQDPVGARFSVLPRQISETSSSTSRATHLAPRHRALLPPRPHRSRA